MPTPYRVIDSSSPYTPSCSYYDIKQEQDLSDNESMAMSVESSPPYSPGSPSANSTKRSFLDVGARCGLLAIFALLWLTCDRASDEEEET